MAVIVFTVRNGCGSGQTESIPVYSGWVALWTSVKLYSIIYYVNYMDKKIEFCLRFC